jgi:hypothetical protein
MVVDGSHPMPPRAEVLCNRAIGGKEALCMTRRFEPLHPPFSLARRLVGVFSTIVQIAMVPMYHTRQYLTLRGAVAFELIGHDHPGHVRQALEQLAEERLRRFLVPPALYQDGPTARNLRQDLICSIPVLEKIVCWLIVCWGDFREQTEPALFPILEGEQAVVSAIFAVECQGQV